MLLNMSDKNIYKFKKEEPYTITIEDGVYLRVVYLNTQFSIPSPISVLVSVPKKRIKSAVKRNRIKRQVREAYRLNKHYLDALIPQNIDLHLDIAFVFVKEELVDFSVIEKGMRKGLTEMVHKLSCNRK